MFGLTSISFFVFIFCMVIAVQLKKKQKRVLNFLADGKCYCDDCIADLCEISKREDVITICKDQKKKIISFTDQKCERCGNLKLTRRLK